MSSQGGKERVSLVHEFNVRNVSEVHVDVIEAAKKAATLVWNKHIGEPTQFNFVFGDKLKIELGEGHTVEPIALYHAKDNIICFGVKSILESNPDLSLEKLVAFASAHETMHKVQNFLDPSLTPVTDFETDTSYSSNPLEEAANKEASEILTHMYPS